MQLGLPTEVTHQELARETSLGGAIALCAKAAGLEPKQVQAELKLDKAQWSRWESGQEGVIWPKLTAVMDHCGNDAPLLWMLQARGYDLSSLRKRETETERELRLAREEIEKLKAEREVERRLFRDLRAAA
jgi:hypothetical protein